jgi:hypothetical protein
MTPRTARLPLPKSTIIKPKDARYERETTEGQVTKIAHTQNLWVQLPIWTPPILCTVVAHAIRAEGRTGKLKDEKLHGLDISFSLSFVLGQWM